MNKKNNIYAVREGSGYTIHAKDNEVVSFCEPHIQALGIPLDQIHRIEMDNFLILSVVRALPNLYSIIAKSISTTRMDVNWTETPIAECSPDPFPRLTEVRGAMYVKEEHPICFPSLVSVEGDVNVAGPISMPVLPKINGKLVVEKAGVVLDALEHLQGSLWLYAPLKAPRLISVALSVYLNDKYKPDEQELRADLPQLQFVGYTIFKNTPGNISMVAINDAFPSIRAEIGSVEIGEVVQCARELQQLKDDVLKAASGMGLTDEKPSYGDGLGL